MKQTDKLFVRTENQTDRCTVYIGGELDLESAVHMRAVMSRLIELDDRELVLNLRELRYVDSTGIGILVSVLKARHAKDAPFAVEAVPPHIRKLFDMTGITPFLLKQA
ncbi:STAS domain-containing protein [Paenibacillus sp. GCM10023250]|uniref:STAS domain-containing protein n=1 Tax=Paenibacillus sp. GCM10023250 TaxID=3252648 RepID=UPI003622606F